MLGIAAAGVLLAVGAAAVALSGGMPHRVSLAERHALIIAVPIAVGLYAWVEGTHRRFGRLLVLAGMAWSLAALSSSSESVLYSVGRLSGWIVEAGLVYLILAFPSGRLTARVDRLLVAAAVVVCGLLFLPTALLSDGYPLPSPLATCDADCPSNAFMLAGSQPAFVDDLVIPLRELLVAALMVAVAVRLAYRIHSATRLMRRTLAPVMAFAILRTLAFALAIALRRAGADESLVDVVALVMALGVPGMAVGFLIGLLSWQLHVANALVALAYGMRRDDSAERHRDLIARALNDPTVELAYLRPGGGWVDADDAPLTLPPPPSQRRATLIHDGERTLAAVIHDAALSDQRPFVEAIGGYALVWDDNHRLAAQVESSLDALRRSRARILAAADDERRRIERDLHDGGQQRLVALRIRLELAEETMTTDPARARAMLHRLGGEVDAALDELRSLAAGVYPAVLVAHGLPDAIRSAALQSSLSVRVRVDGTDRYPEDQEAAVYFCCLEALQNVAKHAPQARDVSIALRRNGDLRFEVADDGPGFNGAKGHGRGLVNMSDRMAAVGGALEVRSVPGVGTKVVGTIPVG